LKQLDDSPSVAFFIFVIITLSDDEMLAVALAVIAETGIDVDIDVISGVR
jgi:hypothetical protein